MAFKTMKTYNEDRGYNDFFMLRNDGDFADVIFLYRNQDDVLVADAHYVKSNDRSGYVHCCGRGCPACGKGIPVQTKLFIPLFNLETNRIEFWDRSTYFENQLTQDVFVRYPNPSDYVFRIIRHGVARSRDTTYEIQVVGRNKYLPYDKIMSDHKTSSPEFYETVIKEYSAAELRSMLDSNNSSSSESAYGGADVLPDYQVKPRTSYSAPSVDDVPWKNDDSSDPAGIASDDDLEEPEF